MVASSPLPISNPNYVELVRFLLQPFLDAPDSLIVDCEMLPSKSRVWIRLSFEGTDKGRVYGRGGRNLQAIRTVLAASAQAVGQSVYLDIYGSHAGMPEKENISSGGDEGGRRHRPMGKNGGNRRSPPPRSRPRN